MHSYILSDPYCLQYYGPLFSCLVCRLLDRLLHPKQEIIKKLFSAPEHAVLNLSLPNESIALTQEFDLGDFLVSLSFSSFCLPIHFYREAISLQAAKRKPQSYTLATMFTQLHPAQCRLLLPLQILLYYCTKTCSAPSVPVTFNESIAFVKQCMAWYGHGKIFVSFFDILTKRPMNCL